MLSIKHYFSAFVLTALSTGLANAQVGIGIVTPDQSAQLQVESADKGILIPRVATTSVVAAPAKGLLVYQTGSPEGFYYNSGTPIAPLWIRLSTLDVAGGDLSGTYPNPTIAGGSVNSFKIADSTIINEDISPNASISYSKLNLINNISNADLTANSVTTSKVANGTVTTSKMADSAISGLKLLTNAVHTRHIADGVVTPSKVSATGAAAGQVLGFDGTNVNWTAATPAGAATGDLTGNYPAPTIANGVVNSAKITDGTIINDDIASSAAISYFKLNLTNSISNSDLTPNSITTSKVANGTITTSKMADSAVSGLKLLTNAVYTRHIADGVVTPAKINTAGATTGQVLGFDGTNVNWTASALSGAASGDLTGNYPAPTIANGAVNSAKIADGSIANDDIASSAAIAYSKLNLINSISNADLVPNSVTTSKVANGTITTSKMADSAVSGLKLLTNAVYTRHIADGVVTPAKINAAGATTGQVLGFDGTNVNWTSAALTGTASGDLTGNYPAPSIANGAVNSAKIADGSIVNDDIASNAAIPYSKLVLTGSIINADLTVNSVTTSRVANGTVTTSKIADSAVSGLKLLTNAVYTRHIADGVVTPAKINTAGATTGQVLSYNGTSAVWSNQTGGGNVTTNSTLSGSGSAGSPLGINTGNSNTWTANQTFGGTFLITSNSRIAMVNSDNVARDIRFQEPSGTGSQYVGFRAPSVSDVGKYILPAVVGTAGQVLSITSFSNTIPGNEGANEAILGWVSNDVGTTTFVNNVLTNATVLTTSSGKYIVDGAYAITLPASPALGQSLRFASRNAGASINMNGKQLFSLQTNAVVNPTNYTFSNTTGVTRKFSLDWDGTYWIYSSEL